MKKPRVFIFLALFISMEIVLTRFFSFETPIIRIGFGFLPLALSAAIFGPVYAGIAAMFADIIGVMLFPKGAYFPGFTLSALLSGLIYGNFLHNKSTSIVRTVLAVLVVSLFVDLGLNTFWLSIITGKAATALFVPRAIKTAIMFPIEVVTINLVCRSLFLGFPLIAKKI